MYVHRCLPLVVTLTRILCFAPQALSSLDVSGDLSSSSPAGEVTMVADDVNIAEDTESRKVRLRRCVTTRSPGLHFYDRPAQRHIRRERYR